MPAHPAAQPHEIDPEQKADSLFTGLLSASGRKLTLRKPPLELSQLHISRIAKRHHNRCTTGVLLPDIKGKDVEMELLLVFTAVAAFVLLVKHTKAKCRIFELTLNPEARQNEVEAQRNDLIQGARNRLEQAEEKLQSAAAKADRIIELARLRDWLLHMLMNGQVTVK